MCPAPKVAILIGGYVDGLPRVRWLSLTDGKGGPWVGTEDEARDAASRAGYEIGRLRDCSDRCRRPRKIERIH